jgi:hypothetical protein
MKKLLAIALAASVAPSAFAALGKVSRSCLPAGAQESITVDWGFVPWWTWTASYHYRNGVLLHSVISQQTLQWGGTSEWVWSWRGYAGHLGTEYWYGHVVGSHYWWDGTQAIWMGTTDAVDCNLSHWGG